MDDHGDHPWRWIYPPLQCHDQGWLEVGDGHAVYWEVCGNPCGAPALFVHGGPGAGCSRADRRWFDPAHYRIVLFDQRGAGRSRPLGCLQANTTQHAVGDIEALRSHLGVDRWLVMGGSWGATLALAYAQSHPQRVRALVLRGVFLGTGAERRWLYSRQGVAMARPSAWRRLTSALPPPRPLDAVEAFSRQLHCGDPATERDAARAWLQWEQDLMAPEPIGPPSTRPAMRSPQPDTSDHAAALATARIGVHFARHHYFLQDGELLAHAGRLRDCPGVIVQGDADLVTPPAAAESLQRAWSGSQLQLLRCAGHATSHPVLAKQLIAATDLLRDPRFQNKEIIHAGPDFER